ncbi:hypothetical protein BDQ17DRAFT_775757 [Cyathus striatus]|nr:hypothetical protein BDQ17DRAFT_775757 [Cyathus striatus]
MCFFTSEFSTTLTVQAALLLQRGEVGRVPPKEAWFLCHMESGGVAAVCVAVMDIERIGVEDAISVVDSERPLAAWIAMYHTHSEQLSASLLLEYSPAPSERNAPGTPKLWLPETTRNSSHFKIFAQVTHNHFNVSKTKQVPRREKGAVIGCGLWSGHCAIAAA